MRLLIFPTAGHIVLTYFTHMSFSPSLNESIGEGIPLMSHLIYHFIDSRWLLTPHFSI